jgi:hypothetical protein
MTKTYTITTGAIESTYSARDEAGAIMAYVNDAGYHTGADAAEACGQNEDEFIADLRVSEGNNE